MSTPVISDRVAKKLWLITSMIAVSALPILKLTTVDYLAWSPEIANEVGVLLVAWSGSVASVLGLSRFSPSAKVETPPTGN